MSTTSVVRRLVGLSIRRPGLLGGPALLVLLERTAIFFGVLYVVRGNRWGAALASCVVAIALLGRGVLQGSLRRQTRTALVRASVRSVLETDVSVLDGGEEALTLVFEGIYVGQDLLSSQLPGVMGDLIASLLVAFTVWLEVPPSFFALGLTGLGLGLLAFVLMRRWTARATASEREANGPVHEAIVDTMLARLDLIGNGRTSGFLNEVTTKLALWQRAAGQSDLAASVARRLPVSAAAITIAAIVGPSEVLKMLAGGSLLSSALILLGATPAFVGLSRGLVDIRRSAIRLEPFAALLEGPQGPRGGVQSALDAPAPIQFRNVSFSYPQAQGGSPVLAGTTFDWHPGQILVLEGPNGSGKSTLLRLMLGLAEPTSGSVAVGGCKLGDLNLHDWRGKIAYLPQRPSLSERASIREVIHLIAPGVADGEIESALRRVGLWEALVERDADAALAVRAGRLSAGQRQRLALARVLCRKAPVVLLDEPDANLDEAGIQMLETVIREASAAGMVAIAAHSPQLGRLGDIRVVLEHRTGAPTATILTRGSETGDRS